MLHGFPQTSTIWTPLAAARLARRGLPHARARPARLLAGRPTARVRAYALPELVADALAVPRRGDRRSRPPRSPRLGRGRGLGARRPAPRPGREPHLPVEPAPAGVPARVAAAPAGAGGLVHRGDRGPGLVEWVHARRPDVLVRLLERSGQSRAAAERDVAVDRTTFTAMLNWYRAMPFGGRDPAWSARRCSTSGGRATTHSCARRPSAAPRWVAGPLTYVELPGANHWLPEQNVDEVAPLLLRHLAAHPASSV